MSTAAVMPPAVESTTIVMSMPALMPISNQEVLTFTPGIPRDIEIDTAMHHFILHPELIQIFNKGCSRHNMAVKLVRRLFNKQTRMMSNVSRHGKEMLDLVLISYAKRIFQVFHSAHTGGMEQMCVNQQMKFPVG